MINGECLPAIKLPYLPMLLHQRHEMEVDFILGAWGGGASVICCSLQGQAGRQGMTVHPIESLCSMRDVVANYSGLLCRC